MDGKKDYLKHLKYNRSDRTTVSMQKEPTSKEWGGARFELVFQ